MRLIVIPVLFSFMFAATPVYAGNPNLRQTMKYITRHPGMAKMACNRYRYFNSKGFPVLSDEFFSLTAKWSGSTFDYQSMLIPWIVGNYCPDVF